MHRVEKYGFSSKITTTNWGVISKYYIILM